MAGFANRLDRDRWFEIPIRLTRAFWMIPVMLLQNAASVAGLLLTTEVMIAEAPKDDDHAHGGAPGGMGGMGGMDM